MIKIKKASALDLEIPGSMGTFAVSEKSSRASVRVKFLQTYVRFALGGDHEEKLLSKLAPVREVFPVKDLDFEQIMQRDIDDARVSTQLIPYLLEESPSGLVKLFPPIIVVVLPMTDSKLPAAYYPSVEEFDETDDNGTWHVVRSGTVGSEVFEFRQFVQDGEKWDHDYARLKLNTSRSALVIVDGQHRAMGLIAMYRNCTRWPDDSKGVEPYYSLWSKQILEKYDLSEVKLPVMFCVFPELDGRETDQIKVYNACRAIFLALNKNARKVTRARNYLLDDRDVVSTFMRAMLTDIKDLSDFNSPSTLRLWNVELDADEDRTALTSHTAITGVTHLFGLIERLTLRQAPGHSLNASRTVGRPQTKLDLCFKRLQVNELLPRAVQVDSRRDTCDSATRGILTEAFRKRFGQYIVLGLSDFAPYRANNMAALALHQKLQAGAIAEFYRTILFEGQNMDQVFREFVESLKKEVKEPGKVRSPELKAVKKEFDERDKALNVEIEDLIRRRLDFMLERCPKDVRENSSIRKALRELYKNTFTTAAFQSALFITFFAVVDEENEDRSKPPSITPPLPETEVADAFDRYLAQLNEFFTTSSIDRIERLLGVFYGRFCRSADGEITVEEWSETLRGILVPGELKPDEWARFRMVFVELWRPNHSEFRKRVSGLRKLLRKQALQSYHERKLHERAQNLGIAVGHMSEAEKSQTTNECIQAFLFGLVQLHQLEGSSRDKAEKQLRRYLEEVAESAAEEEESV